jgi:glycosyltransferase involved in cell wall biosynthesis
MLNKQSDSTTEKHLHLVCLDVPWPVDYGGVFDLFYKIKALSEAGVKIYLHCYEYGRGRQAILNKYCEEVNYYERTSPAKSLLHNLPYIVASRANKKLLHRLQQDNYPVLMEGMHCTWFVHTGEIDRKRAFVRLHNVEYRYYKQLAETTHVYWKKMYYNRESRLLKEYERELAGKADFWTVTPKDLGVFVNELGYNNVDYLPLYLPEYQTEYSGQKGHYCLYHGNLSVPENEEAAIWLLEKIFTRVTIPFVIAGKNPSGRLNKMAHSQNHTCIVSNPDEIEMTELIKKAHVNILPSMNETGIKLKLVNALYNGRHCLVNSAGVDGSGLNQLCTIANSSADMQNAVVTAYELPYTQLQFDERMQSLRRLFNNKNNAQQMISWIFGKEPTYPGGSRVGIA